MHKNQQISVVCGALMLLITACGSEDPSFVTHSLGKYAAEVKEGGSIDPDSLTYSVESSLDEPAYAEEALSTDEEWELDLGETLEREPNQISQTASGKGLEKSPGHAAKATIDRSEDAKVAKLDHEKAQAKAEPVQSESPKDDTKSRSDDAAEQVASTDDNGQPATSPGESGKPAKGSDDAGEGSPNSEDAALAKSCAPHFRGIASKIRVLHANQLDQAITIAPDTVIVVHLRGNGDVFNLDLGASAGIAGLCLILTGNSSSAIVSTASSLQKLVYVGRGNESQGQLTMKSGATIASLNIELSGNQPRLDIQGVPASACSKARLKGNAPKLQCGN